MRLFALFLLWPLAEIALFVTLGGAIGLVWTLLVIAGSAMLGIWLLRSRGVRSAAEMRRGLHVVRGGGLGQLAGDVLVMLAAVLLILPGFLTDALGLLLLLPPVRALVILWAARRVGDGIRAHAARAQLGRHAGATSGINGCVFNDRHGFPMACSGNYGVQALSCAKRSGVPTSVQAPV